VVGDSLLWHRSLRLPSLKLRRKQVAFIKLHSMTLVVKKLYAATKKPDAACISL
jgi:hypothetical protein